MLTVQNFAAPAPSYLHVQVDDARFSAQQTLSGHTHVSRAAVKRRVQVRWAHMSPENLKSLLQAVTEAPLISLTFPDPMTGDTLSMTAYSLGRSVGLYRMHGNTPVWTDIEMTFMES